MRDLYKIFAELEKRKIAFCFQCQGTNNYYNITFEDAQRKTHTYNSEYVDFIEQRLKEVWGGLLTPTSTLPLPIPGPR